MRRFVELQLAPGVEPPAPPPGPTPPWMAKRPAGIKALTGAFAAWELDLDALGAFPGPVYYALGARSNPDYFGAMAERLGGLFGDYTLDVFEERHHFDPRTGPSRSASRRGCARSGSACPLRPAEERRGWTRRARSTPTPSTRSRSRPGEIDHPDLIASSSCGLQDFRAPRGSPPLRLRDCKTPSAARLTAAPDE